jgi:hypothetical protein
METERCRTTVVQKEFAMTRDNIPQRPRVSRARFLFALVDALIDQIPNNLGAWLSFTATIWFLVALDPASVTWFSPLGIPGVLIAKILTVTVYAWHLCRNWDYFTRPGEEPLLELLRAVLLLLLPLLTALYLRGLLS